MGCGRVGNIPVRVHGKCPYCSGIHVVSFFSSLFKIIMKQNEEFSQNNTEYETIMNIEVLH